jgi:hypothetical protein
MMAYGLYGVQQHAGRYAALWSAAVLLLTGALPLAAQGRGGQTLGPPEPIDTAAIVKIKDEGFNRSQVMDIMSWLTDVHGPRLTGSPITKRAGDWTIEQFKKWGLTNPRYEWWGPFGRGWVNDRTIAQVTAPVAFPVIGYPGAWSDGTNGVVSNEVVLVPNTIRTAAEFAPYRGKLKGKIVITQPARELAALFSAPGDRYTQEELDRLSNPFPVATAGRGGRGGRGGGRGGQPQPAPTGSPAVNLNQCFQDEGVAAILSPGGGNSHGGNVFVSGSGSRAADAARAIPQVSLTPEHYGRIYRILQKGIPVRMDLDVKNTFYTQELNSFNILADIPGTDKADEVVMVGAHFDSWHAGTGATDNAAGSAVMMEAMRILKTLGLPMRRTVRIGLWTGEEQGLIGSREYVTAHFANRQDMQLKPEHAKFSAYYNVDNGTGAIRGIYLQGNSAVGSIFSQWMRVLNSDSISVGHIAPGNTGGTDHQSFDAVGLPGFQFIQDGVEYGSRTHHSSQDLYERIQATDMKHNAVAVAAFVYLTANRAELLPRKPLPQAQGARGGGGGGGGGGGRGGAGATPAPPACPKA